MFNALGNAHFDRGNFNEAITAYYRGLEIEQKKFEPAHPNIIVTLFNISQTYRHLGDFDLAIQVCKEVFRLQQQRFGLSHPDVSKTLHLIALLYDTMGNLSQALECNNYSLSLQQHFKNNRDNHSLSLTLTHAGCLLYRMNEISTAKKHFDEALSIQRQTDNDDEVAFTVYNIGLCHQARGCYRKAIKCYKEALELEEKVHGRDHRETIPTIFSLGQVYAALGQYEKAIHSFQHALRIEREKRDGQEEGPCTRANILIEIGYVHYFQGNVDQVTKILSEISGIDKTFDFTRKSMLCKYLQMCHASCRSLAPAA